MPQALAATTNSGGVALGRLAQAELEGKVKQLQRDMESVLEQAALKDRRIRDLEAIASASMSQAEVDEQQRRFALLVSANRSSSPSLRRAWRRMFPHISDCTFICAPGMIGAARSNT